MVESTKKGLLTELYCKIAFTKYGFLLSQPLVQDSKYDYIADINHKLIKIQCKTASVGSLQDFITIDCYTTNIRSGQINYYSNEDVDYFYTYYNGIDYLIPYNVGGQKTKTLRFTTKQNFINPNIHWAKDYTLEKILEKDFDIILELPNVTVIQSNVKEQSNNFCIDCGTPISKNAIRCVKCSHKLQMVTERPEREVLKEMIRNKPFIQIGNEYGVSDNAVRKWCLQYNLPSKKKDIKLLSEEEWKLI